MSLLLAASPRINVQSFAAEHEAGGAVAASLFLLMDFLARLQVRYVVILNVNTARDTGTFVNSLKGSNRAYARGPQKCLNPSMPSCKVLANLCSHCSWRVAFIRINDYAACDNLE